jgi:hypothetical protein
MDPVKRNSLAFDPAPSRNPDLRRGKYAEADGFLNLTEGKGPCLERGSSSLFRHYCHEKVTVPNADNLQWPFIFR